MLDLWHAVPDETRAMITWFTGGYLFGWLSCGSVFLVVERLERR